LPPDKAEALHKGLNGMGWLVALACVILLVVLARRTSDRETIRNLGFLGKFLVGFVAFIVLLGCIFLIAR
jgi:hypothetical protein